MEIAVVIGILGMSALVFAFVLEEFTKHTKIEQKKFTILNLLGSSLLLYYAIAIFAVPFIILNIIWLLIAIRALTTNQAVEKQLK